MSSFHIWERKKVFLANVQFCKKKKKTNKPTNKKKTQISLDLFLIKTSQA